MTTRHPGAAALTPQSDGGRRVAGGIADFFGISPFWFRLCFLISLIPGGVPGLAVYALAWLIMPSE